MIPKGKDTIFSSDGYPHRIKSDNYESGFGWSQSAYACEMAAIQIEMARQSRDWWSGYLGQQNLSGMMEKRTIGPPPASHAVGVAIVLKGVHFPEIICLLSPRFLV